MLDEYYFLFVTLCDMYDSMIASMCYVVRCSATYIVCGSNVRTVWPVTIVA